MSLQTQFENMVSQRPSPNVPQMNPNDSDITRGLQVASFAMDTIGQVVRSERQSEAAQYQQKAQQAMQNAYEQKGSSQQALMAANRFAQNVPAWARESVAASMSEFLGIQRMAIENDQLINQEENAQNQARISAMREANERLYDNVSGRIGSDEQYKRSAQLAVGAHLYNQENGTSISMTEYGSLVASGQVPNTAEAMNPVALTEFLVENPSILSQTEYSDTMVKKNTELQGLQVEIDEASTAEGRRQALSRTLQVQQDILDISKGQADLLISTLPSTVTVQDAERIAVDLEGMASYFQRTEAMFNDDSARRGFSAEHERLTGIAERIRELPNLELQQQEIELRSLQVRAQLSEDRFTALKAVFGDAGVSAFASIIIQSDPQFESDIQSGIRGMLDNLIDPEGTMSRAQRLDTMSQISQRVISGGATEEDWDIVSANSLGTIMRMEQDGFSEEEQAEILAVQLPLLFNGSILSSDTESGRRNAVQAYRTLSGVINEDNLDDDERTIWNSLKANSAVQETIDDRELLQAVNFAYSSQGRATTTTRVAEGLRIGANQERVNQWIDSNWEETKERFTGTVYEDVFADPETYLSFVSQVNGSVAGGTVPDPAVSDFNQLGATALADLLQKSREMAENVGAEAVEFQGKSIEEFVTERIASGRRFFGVTPSDIMEPMVWTHNGEEKSTYHYSLDKLETVLRDTGLTEGMETPEETPAPVETPTEPEAPEVDLNSPVEDQARAEMEEEGQVSIDELEGDERESRIIELNESATRVNDEVIEDLRSNLTRAGVPDDVAGGIHGCN